MWYEVTRWKAYRSISYEEMRWYVWYLPLLFVAVILVISLLIPSLPGSLEEGGVISVIQDVTKVLPGFYIAALAAVSTFSNDTLDEAVPSVKPLELRTLGKDIPTTVSTRLFLSLLFSYLTVLSFAVLILSTFGIMLKEPLGSINVTDLSDVSLLAVSLGKYLYIGFVLYLTGSLAATSLQGIYFLAEKIHRPTDV